MNVNLLTWWIIKSACVERGKVRVDMMDGSYWTKSHNGNWTRHSSGFDHGATRADAAVPVERSVTYTPKQLAHEFRLRPQIFGALESGERQARAAEAA